MLGLPCDTSTAYILTQTRWDSLERIYKLRSEEFALNYIIILILIICLLLIEFAVRTVITDRVFSTRIYGHKSERKKRGYVTYNTDRENEVSKIFMISLGSKRWRLKQTFEFSGPYSRPITARVLINRRCSMEQPFRRGISGNLLKRILASVIETRQQQNKFRSRCSRNLTWQ